MSFFMVWVFCYFMVIFSRLFDNFFLSFHRTSWGRCWFNVKTWILLNHSKCLTQSQEGQLWSIFTKLCILFSSNEGLPYIIVFNVKTWILLNHSKCLTQCQEGQLWSIFTKLCILFSSNEGLPYIIVRVQVILRQIQIQTWPNFTFVNFSC